VRIAQVSTLNGPVHLERGGSIEQLVWFLTRELTRLGHEVTVFGTAGSEPGSELVATLPGPYGKDGSPNDWQLCEWINLARAVEQSSRFDVIHSHAYLWGLPLGRVSSAPMVHTLHTMPSLDDVRLRRIEPQEPVVGISEYQWSGCPRTPVASVVHHGVDPAQFTYRPEPDDHLVFIGRFLPGKGALAAIETARVLDIPLRLAGPRNDYYRAEVEPLVDGRSVEYVGWVSGSVRDELLGRARALLYPLRDPEPFGLVLVEAMMCGTPVAALRIGAVPEIVAEGITGCTADSPADYPAAVMRTLGLDRSLVRRHAESRFSVTCMAEGYVRAYEDAIASRMVGGQP
jgi:glycosyltransferase involved in cell wall biosynthesis